MTAFSFGARLHLGANSDLALSLPQSRLCILWARQLCPLAVSATGGARKPNPSEGAEAATAVSHRFSFAVKVRRKRYPLSPIQPLSHAYGVPAPLTPGSREPLCKRSQRILHRGGEKNFEHGAGAPSPPSEEGGGCLHKGFEQADGGRDTPSMCEST